jgi:hypothetical protein
LGKQENIDAIKNSAAVIVNTVGNGRVINIADNPNFRAFWLGGSKLFMNAIFFGRIIDAAVQEQRNSIRQCEW